MSEKKSPKSIRTHLEVPPFGSAGARDVSFARPRGFPQADDGSNGMASTVPVHLANSDLWSRQSSPPRIPPWLRAP
jgi:hypothetical protein